MQCMLYITHSKGDNYYISSKRLLGPLVLAATTLERETVVPLALSKAVFVFLTAIFSNVPVLSFDVCSKCQRECLPKPAGKKKRLSPCEEPERFTFYPTKALKNTPEKLYPQKHSEIDKLGY